MAYLQIHDAFVNAVIENIGDRFPQAELIDCFKIFDPQVNELPTTIGEAEEASYSEANLGVSIEVFFRRPV